LARPNTALDGLTAENPPFKGPFAIFLIYSALHSLVLPKLPSSFVPEAPAAAFGNPFYYYLSAAPLNLFTAALLAAIIFPAVSFFSSGRIGVRVILAVLSSASVFIAASASGKAAAVSWLLLAGFIAFAAVSFRRHARKSRAMFSVMLAASSISLAALPASTLSIYLNSKILFAIFTAIETLWIVWLLIKALGRLELVSVPRTAAAVFFTAALCGALLFALAKLLPDYLAAVLLIC